MNQFKKVIKESREEKVSTFILAATAILAVAAVSFFAVKSLKRSTKGRFVGKVIKAEGFKYTLGSRKPAASFKYGPIIALANPETGRTFCSGVVVDARLALTASHCVANEFMGLSTDPVMIKSSTGVDTGVTAQPVVANPSIDLAAIEGDFSEFLASPLSRQRPTQGMHYQSCGFGGGVKEVQCTVGMNLGAIYFFDTYTLKLLPGMSGGPVYDLISGEVIGINSAVNDQGVSIIAPTVAVKGFLDLE